MGADCPYGKIMKQGTRTWIYCQKSKMSCMFQRYCIHKKSIVFTAQSVGCKLRNNE